MLTARVRTSLLVTGAAVFAIAGLVVLGIGAGVGGGLGPMVAGMVLIGIGGGGVLGSITPTMTVLGERSDPPAIGAAFAVFNLAYAAGLFIGPALSGPMVQVAGFGPAMGLLAGALAIAALSGSLGLRQRLGS
jgi:MFS family permease